MFLAQRYYTPVIMMVFKYFLAAVWLSFCINVPTVTATHRFRAYLTSGSNYIRSGSGIYWVRRLSNPGSGSCDMQGTIRLPFNSRSCYRFIFFLTSNPTGFNFHIDNGCGDGWGGTYRCYEVHNYGRGFSVYPRTGSGQATHFANAIGTRTDVTIQRGKVGFRSNGITRTVYSSTLFTNSYVYFSMNRVYNLNRYPNPPRVGTGLCRVWIYSC